MAARLAGPRIPPGGVGLAIRARMTRSASCRRRARSTGDAIIQRPPRARFRNRITGIEPGRVLAVEGMLSQQGGRKIMYNPRYDLGTGAAGGPVPGP